MTVVANLPPVVSGGGRTLRMSLMDKSCGPKDMNGTRALFSFPVNSCGFIFEVKAEFTDLWHPLCCFALTLYFFFSLEKITWLIKMTSSTRRMTRIWTWFLVMPLRGMNLKTFLLIYIYIFSPTCIDPWHWRLSLFPRVIVQCTYPLSSLHQLFTMYRFVSDTVGVGKIIRTVQPTAGTVTYSHAGNDALFKIELIFFMFLGLQRPTRKPTAALQSTPRHTQPVVFVPGVHPSARYFSVSRVLNLAGG